MRPLHHGDLACAARALLPLPAHLRRFACARMIAEAEAAHAHMERTGRLHPRWGNGALMASARRRDLPPEPCFDDAEYRACWAVVLAALAKHTFADPGRQPRISGVLSGWTEQAVNAQRG